ncbi:MAG TPA: CAP domain-containing protein [Mycobacteriales bacterium]|nr:CAP domain-containing protein [Mycobacteriales bacterium]
MLRSLAAAALALTATLAVAAPAQAEPSPDVLVAKCGHLTEPAGTKPQVLMLAEINCARKVAGVAPLHGFRAVGGVASRWTLHMAETQRLAHNPNRADEVTAVDARWTLLGEIVGATQTGTGDVDRITTSWFKSAVHRHVILNPKFHAVGIGIKPGSGWVWATCDFVDA